MENTEHAMLAGSFTRGGRFPIEADYIFESEEALNIWANSTYIKPTLHEGLLKIVKNGDEQELYWVVKKNGDYVFEKYKDKIKWVNT